MPKRSPYNLSSLTAVRGIYNSPSQTNNSLIPKRPVVIHCVYTFTCRVMELTFILKTSTTRESGMQTRKVGGDECTTLMVQSTRASGMLTNAMEKGCSSCPTVTGMKAHGATM